MKNCYNLRLDFPVLKEGFVFPKPKSLGWDIYILPAEELISTEAIKFFKQLDLTLYNCHLFKGPPSLSCRIHIDGHESNLRSQPVWAINWVMGSAKSDMIWYEPITAGSEKKNDVGTDYQVWALDEVKEIERSSFAGPTLVRTDIPHRAINYDMRNTRWCVSLRTTRKLVTWDAAVEYFKPYIDYETKTTD
jgi:hypothetical protein